MGECRYGFFYECLAGGKMGPVGLRFSYQEEL